jgi:magnesium transporter
VVNTHQRPKVEPYDDHLYLVAQMAYRTEFLRTEQVSLFLGPGYVVTFQEREGDCLEPVRTRIRKGGPRLRNGRADYLAYAVLDAVVDHYFPITEEYGDLLESLQTEILSDLELDASRRIHALRSDLLTLRRVLHPLRDAISSLLREDSPLIEEGTLLYFRDCHDHIIQLLDLLQVDRETASGLMDLHLSAVSNRMNDIMKVLTIFAAIFIPLTFIAGIYGMNFNTEASPWNLPELDWYWGYPLALGSMAVIAVLMLVYFWKKGFFR